MNMIVCVKQVIDPEAPPASFKIDTSSNSVVPPAGVPPVISPFDEQAVEAALRIKDAMGGQITAISLGTGLLRDVVKKPLSMGADELVLLEDTAPAGEFDVVTGVGSSGSTGITAPLPAGTRYYLVSGRNAGCGMGL